MAYFVPYTDSIASFSELEAQAIALSYAEGISSNAYPDRLAATWGAIGLKFHPDRSDSSIAHRWREQLKNSQSFDHAKYAIGDERPSISRDGILNFDCMLPEGFDYMMGTPVVPNVDSYPTPEEIVQAIEDSPSTYEEYVQENIRHGIQEPSHERLVELRPSLNPTMG